MKTKTFVKCLGSPTRAIMKTVLQFGCLLVVGACASNEPRRNAALEVVTKCVATEGASLGFCGCTDPVTGEAVSCTPMPYDQCPAPADGTAVDNPITVAYNGPVPGVATYSCGSPPPPACDHFVLATNAAFVAEFLDHSTLKIYPTTASNVTSPTGLPLFSLRAEGEPFADPAKRVDFNYAGTAYTRFLVYQNDCFQNCQCNDC